MRLVVLTMLICYAVMWVFSYDGGREDRQLFAALTVLCALVLLLSTVSAM